MELVIVEDAASAPKFLFLGRLLLMMILLSMMSLHRSEAPLAVQLCLAIIVIMEPASSMVPRDSTYNVLIAIGANPALAAKWREVVVCDDRNRSRPTAARSWALG